MGTLNYKVHFGALLLAMIALWLTYSLTIPDWIERAVYVYGLVGVLHACALVVSLPKSAAVLRRVTFVALAGVASVLQAWVPALIFPALWMIPGMRTSDSPIFEVAWLFGATFFGAAYWLLVRGFWLRSLKLVNLLITLVLCGGTTLFAVTSAGELAVSRGVSAILPTAAWWVAFSISLYVGEGSEALRQLSSRRNDEVRA